MLPTKPKGQPSLAYENSWWRDAWNPCCGRLHIRNWMKFGWKVATSFSELFARSIRKVWS